MKHHSEMTPEEYRQLPKIYVLQSSNIVCPGLGTAGGNLGVYTSLESLIEAVKNKTYRLSPKPKKDMGLEIWGMDGQIMGVHTVRVVDNEVQIL
jgi:hypothetical protein